MYVNFRELDIIDLPRKTYTGAWKCIKERLLVSLETPEWNCTLDMETSFSLHLQQRDDLVVVIFLPLVIMIKFDLFAYDWPTLFHLIFLEFICFLLFGDPQYIFVSQPDNILSDLLFAIVPFHYVDKFIFTNIFFFFLNLSIFKDHSMYWWI